MRSSARGNNELMEDLAKRSAAQATSIEDLTTAIRQMDEMTQHNAALVEQTNAAISQTEAQARKLDSVIDVFQLAKATHAAPAGHTHATAAEDRARKRHVSRARLNASLSDQGNAVMALDWAEF
jgi:methyl-accepting chemotaxis protein